MAYPAPFTQAQLEMACGGADKLRGLIDKTDTGDLASAPCQAYIVEIQQAAAGDLYSILQVAFDPADPTFQGAAFVQQNAVTLGLYWTWHKSTAGTAIPDEVKTGRAEAIANIKDARSGGRSLGTDVNPTSNVQTEQVTIDTTGTRITRGNMGGFC